MSARARLRTAAGIWFLFSAVMLIGIVNELGRDGRPGQLFLGTALMVATAWLGYRLLRRPSRDIGIVAACFGGFFVVFALIPVLNGVSSLPLGIAAVILAALGGTLPLSAVRSDRAGVLG